MRSEVLLFCLSLVAVKSKVHRRSAVYHDLSWREQNKAWFEQELCATVYCDRGEECLVIDGVAECVCKKDCPTRANPVCGSDGEVYLNHCTLHREACVKQKRIHIVELNRCQIETKGVTFELSNAGQSESTPATTTTVHHMSAENATDDPTLERGDIVRLEQPATVHDTQNMPTTVTLTSTSTVQPAVTPAPICDQSGLNALQNNLLLYYHSKYGTDRSGRIHRDRAFLVPLMFDKLDANMDSYLNASELAQAESEWSLDALESVACKLAHLTQFYDVNQDDRLSRNEFLKAFGLPAASVPPDRQVVGHTVKQGVQYQLVCEIKADEAERQVVWFRYNTAITSVTPYNLEVSPTGDLYLAPAHLVHTGNFSCRLAHHPTVEQVHVIRVTEALQLEVKPDLLVRRARDSAVLFCDVKGTPAARLMWYKNGRQIDDAQSSMLRFASLDPADTGTYSCVAYNGYSKANASASLLVRDNFDSQEALLLQNQQRKPVVAAFGSKGVATANLEDCKLDFFIRGNVALAKLGGSPSQLCGQSDCDWSDATITSPANYMYAALAKQRKLVVIDVTRHNVHEVFDLVDCEPMHVQYTHWDDTVWLECWHDSDGRAKSIHAVRSATDGISHNLLNILRVGDHFDTIENFFLPTDGEQAAYAYVVHAYQLGVDKVELKTLKTVSSIDFHHYNCHPAYVTFALSDGLAFFACLDTTSKLANGLMVVDYLSDSVLHHLPDLLGKPVVTPDRQQLLTINFASGRILVHKTISQIDVNTATAIDEFLPISETLFYPATHKGYDLYTISHASSSLYRIGLNENKVVQTTEVGNFLNVDHHRCSKRLLAKPAWSPYIIVASQAKLLSINVATQNVHCQLDDDVMNTTVLLWTTV